MEPQSCWTINTTVNEFRFNYNREAQKTFSIQCYSTVQGLPSGAFLVYRCPRSRSLLLRRYPDNALVHPNGPSAKASSFS